MKKLNSWLEGVKTAQAKKAQPVLKAVTPAEELVPAITPEQTAELKADIDQIDEKLGSVGSGYAAVKASLKNVGIGLAADAKRLAQIKRQLEQLRLSLK